ncbi:MAG: OmpA family protein [Planctomycetaceae bacterium]|jgi:chemotaxis protein MotB|nr:OmpA family protein [Planctomycetaceae bacterium]
MKKPHIEEVEEEEVAPFWMISFSDLMTLLLSFFIILFSISTIEQTKMTELMQAMGARYISFRGRIQLTKEARFDPNLPETKEIHGEGEQAYKTPLPASKELAQGTVVPFGLGEDQLNTEGQKTLTALADQLRGRPYTIQVRGHASPSELGESGYKALDDLAYARAWNVREFLMLKNLKPSRFVLVVSGSFHPLSQVKMEQQLVRMQDPNLYVEVIEVAE